MRILLTGATGYIGKRLLPVLIDKGYHVVCCVRDKSKFNPPASIAQKIEVIEVDLTKKETLDRIPLNIDFAYYLVHSMSSTKHYADLEHLSATNFRESMNRRSVKQVIYLSGISNSAKLSKHLTSRKNVESELRKGDFALTTLRAGIIIGSGSAPFEIIRDLVEKLPVMIAPKWLKTKCQPIGISDVIKILVGVLNHPETLHQSYDIAGREVLTYKEMLLEFAKVRGLKRTIWTVPVMTPKLSSYWLYFITSTSYRLAVSLVDSMKIDVIAKPNNLLTLLNINPSLYNDCITKAFKNIEQNEIISSWKDSTISGRLDFKVSDYLDTPQFGCYKDVRSRPIIDEELCLNNLWQIGGENGWYYANALWKVRGFLDKVFGGVGLRRGRTSRSEINAGDALDFWRVLYANKSEKRLLLFAEMKLPGEAWLEFKIVHGQLVQTATFRPKGLLGRAYWFGVFPLHALVFKGMINNISKHC
jgi:uncharacterized protein YbjT (DUF2867 family)